MRYYSSAQSAPAMTSPIPSNPEYMAIAQPETLSIPRPAFHAPFYMLHGLPFSALAPDLRQFLVSHGIVDPAGAPLDDGSASSVTARCLGASLMQTVASLCERIANLTLEYKLLRAAEAHQMVFLPPAAQRIEMLQWAMYRVLLPALSFHVWRHLHLADALVWAELAATPEALDEFVQAGSGDGDGVEWGVQLFRYARTRELVERVNTYLVDLYAWAASKWTEGWRWDGASFFRVHVLPASVMTYSSPASYPASSFAPSASSTPLSALLDMPLTPESLSPPRSVSPASDHDGCHALLKDAVEALLRCETVTEVEGGSDPESWVPRPRVSLGMSGRVPTFHGSREPEET